MKYLKTAKAARRQPLLLYDGVTILISELFI